MDEVIDRLWVTDIGTVRTETVDVDHVVTVCQDDVEDNVGCDYDFFPMSDGPHNKYGGRHDYAFFAEAVETVKDAYRAGKEVLVHCHVGRSRSPSVAIAVVGAVRDVDFKQAYDIVSDARYIQPDGKLAANAQRYIDEYRGFDSPRMAWYNEFYDDTAIATSFEYSQQPVPSSCGGFTNPQSYVCEVVPFSWTDPRSREYQDVCFYHSQRRNSINA